MRRNLILACGILVAMSAIALGDALDPGIKVIGGDPSSPCSAPLTAISTGINSVSANGSCDPDVFNFFNDFSQRIDGFTFSTTVAPGYNPSLLTCSSGFFESCTVDYSPTSGALEYLFGGVLTPPALINCCSDGAMEGIAPGAVFHIELDGFTYDTALYTSQYPPAPFVNSVEVVPEPSTIVSLLIGFLLLAVWFGIRNRPHSVFARVRHLPLAKFAFVLTLGAAVCSASPIFYVVDDTVGAGLVTGFIETDGNTGSLHANDIVNWNLELTDGVTPFNLLGPGYTGLTNSFLLFQGNDLSATPLALLFNYDATDSGVLLFQSSAVGTNVDGWCAASTNGAGTNPCVGPPYGSGQGLETTGPPLQFTSISGTGVIGAVPEPVTISFAALGLLGILLLGRRFARTSVK